MDDWRLIGNFEHIIGHKFKKVKFKSNNKNDHEHCVFCWTKITDIDIDEPHLIEGYVTISKKNQSRELGLRKMLFRF